MKEKTFLQRKFTEYTGCLHVHSEHSYDSETPLAEILEAAQKRKLDFIGINDHSSINAQKEDILKKCTDLLVIPGMEINDQDNNNHLLVYGSSTVLKNKPAQEYVKYYARENAVTFAAHPFEKRATSRLRKYVWTDKNINQFNGLEIWNALSNWIAKIRPQINGLLWVLLAHSFIKRASRKSINWWDEMNRQGLRKAAIGSVDAHGFVLHKFGLKFTILKHNFMFRTIHTNVLLNPDEKFNQENILNALAAGRSYIVNYHRGFPYNFYAGIAGKGQKGVSFGEEIPLQGNLHFYYQLPQSARVKLFRNGSEEQRQWQKKGSFPITKKGNYRLEILKFNTGWIYTNNIYVV